MKKLFLTLLFFGALCSATAQNRATKGYTCTYETRVATTKLAAKRPFCTYEFSIANGYRFTPAFALRLPVEAVLWLLDGAERTYRQQSTLGLNASYSILNGAIEFGATCGSTITKQDQWQYVYYDCGARFAMSYSSFCSLGVKHYQTYGNSTIGPKTTLYTSFGFAF